jgi:hypothetical protein
MSTVLPPAIRPDTVVGQRIRNTAFNLLGLGGTEPDDSAPLAGLAGLVADEDSLEHLLHLVYSTPLDTLATADQGVRSIGAAKDMTQLARLLAQLVATRMDISWESRRTALDAVVAVQTPGLGAE